MVRHKLHIKEQSVILLTFALDFFCSFRVPLTHYSYCSFLSHVKQFLLQMAENINDLKNLIEKPTNTITQQNLTIQNLNDRQNIVERKQVCSQNSIYQLEKRALSNERYQNRPFSIFTNLDISEDGNVLPQILHLSNEILKVSLNADEISIAHALRPGKIAPLLYNFCICNKEM